MVTAGQSSAEHEEQLFHVPSVIFIQTLNTCLLGRPYRPIAWRTFHVWQQAGLQKQPSACAPGHSSQMELIREKSTNLASQSHKLLSRQGRFFHPVLTNIQVTNVTHLQNSQGRYSHWAALGKMYQPNWTIFKK